MIDLFNKLFEPFPAEVRQTKSQGGQKITFVSWIHYVVRAWNTFPQGYSKKLTVSNVHGVHVDKKTGEHTDIDTLIVTCRITCNETGAYQEALGSADCGKTSWGGAIAEAESQAMRRAFANWGLGLEMYMDDDEFQRVTAAVENPKEKIAPEDVATPRQMEVLKQLGTFLDVIGDNDDDVAALVAEKRNFLKSGVTKAKAGIVIKSFRETLAGLGYEDPTKSGEDS